MLSGLLAVLLVGTLAGSVEADRGDGCNRAQCYPRYDRGYYSGCGDYNSYGGCRGYRGYSGMAAMVATTGAAVMAGVVTMVPMAGPAVDGLSTSK
jgi:hypothetical protein